MSIPVVIAADENFAIGAGVLMQSVLEHASRPVHFYFFHDRLSAASEQKLRQTVAGGSGAELTLIDAADALQRLPSPLRTDAYSKMTYARLLAPNYVPADRAVYLDSDTLVRDDVAELHDADLNGAPLAAVPDYGAVRLALRSVAERDYFNQAAGGRGVEDYFNAGVLTMDLGRLRRGGVLDRALGLIASGQRLRMADQCALNLAAEGDYAPLPERWNVMVPHADLPSDKLAPLATRRRVQAAFADPAVLHYVGPKPWTLFPTNQKREFQAVLRRSPWRGHQPRLSELPWKQKQALLKAWRSEIISLHVRRRQVRVKMFGHAVVDWSQPIEHPAA